MVEATRPEVEESVTLPMRPFLNGKWLTTMSEVHEQRRIRRNSESKQAANVRHVLRSSVRRMGDAEPPKTKMWLLDKTPEWPTLARGRLLLQVEKSAKCHTCDSALTIVSRARTSHEKDDSRRQRTDTKEMHIGTRDLFGFLDRHTAEDHEVFAPKHGRVSESRRRC